MKKWNNPEMIDLDVKLTQDSCGNPDMSGGFDKPEKDHCNLCGHPITHPEDFHNNGNHNANCLHSTHGENGPCPR